MHAETVVVLVVSAVFFSFPIWVPMVQRLLNRKTRENPPGAPESSSPLGRSTNAKKAAHSELPNA